MLKKFMFFDHALVTRPDSNEPLPELKEVNVCCSASGYGMLIVGDLNGLVHVFGKNFTNHVYFRAHTDRVEKMHHIRLLSGSRDKPEINLLTTIGSDANSPNIMRIWDLNPCLGTYGQLDLQPIFQTSIPIEPRLNILCSSATLDLNKRNAPGTLPFKLALGMNNGKVLVYDQIDPRNSKAPPTVILQGNTYPITGLFWSKNGDANTKILFITTTHTINSYNFNPMIRDLDATECLDSEKGCNLNCASLLNYSRKRGTAKPQPYEYLTVATKENLKAGLLESRDVIEFYTVETRAGCHPFDGEKQQICTFKNHIVLVGKTGIQNLNMLEIFDHKNKHIAFSLSFSAITQLVSEWDKLYVFTREGKVFELEEKDVQKKIESLKEKKLFAEAIDLGEKELDHDRESLARLYHLYGDELYRKNNYDGAKDQYIQTIGYLESSYVIRKMLDSQSIENLAQYLQELHKKKQVNSLHTTMLLNCYTKLKNPEKLLEFLQENEVEFDVKKAIDACRQAAQSTQDDATSRKFTFVALSLSKSKKFNEEYIKILIEDKPMRNLLGIIFCHPEKIWSRYPQTSDLMNDLHFTRMIENIVRDPRTFFDYLQYSKLYVAISCPVVVSSIPSDSPDEFSTSSSSSSSSSSSPLEHHILVPSSSSETEQTIVIHLPKESIDLLDKLNFQIALADLKGFKSEEKARYLRLYGKQILEAEPEQTIAILEELSRDPTIEVQTFFPIFVKNNAHLKRFIDLLMTQETQLQNNALCDTLLELQLEELDNKTAIDNAAEESSSETSILAAQMKDMLEKNDGFRKYNALVLSKFHEFHSGTLHFLKKIDGGQQVVKFYMETDNDVELFKYCQEKIGNDAVMWSEVLRFVAKGQKPTMPKVIKHIMDNHILPLMLVVQILSENKNIELSVIKDFILGQVREKDQQIRAETLEIEQKQKQTEDVQKEIHDLKTQAKEFKTSKCTTCGLDLDLPTVHFLCGHSYHRKCMGGFVNICPHNDCQDLNQNIQAFEQEVSTNEEFFKLLRSSDNFTVVTEFLAKGLFTKAANPTTFTPTVSVLPTVHGSAEPQQYGLYSGGYGYGGSSSSSSGMYGGGYGASRSFYYGGNK